MKDDVNTCRKQSAPVAVTPDDDGATDAITARLQRRFEHAPPEDLAEIAAAAMRAYAATPVRNFVPILAERLARQEADRRFAARLDA